MLNVNTAKDFFEFYGNRQRGLNLEMERETVVMERAHPQRKARLTVNGKPVGHAATMKSKNEAELVAYLTAAVEIAATNEELLTQFREELKKGHGRILRPLSSIDLNVEFEALQSMRSALVEARNAGLPDSRQALTPELPDSGRPVVRRSKRLEMWQKDGGNRELLSRLRRLETDPAMEQMRSAKAALPLSEYRDNVLKLVSDNLYSIVVGSTGSGKTTQVPQILFEDAIRNGKGGSCNVICTQPRRIAASSVARRVAQERKEPLRATIGYHVRFDFKLPYHPYGITYCTTGILLEKLKHDPEGLLDTTSYLVIDEVHERDLNIDFLMILVKRAIRMRQDASKTVPKVILMSATLDIELFSRYFQQTDKNGNVQPCASLIVPGRTYPVTAKYLGSVMQELFDKYGTEVKKQLEHDQATREYLEAETSFSAKQNNTSSDSMVEPVIDWKRQALSDPENDLSGANEKEEALVPVSLLVSTIGHICKSSKEGAVLAFLPGLDEIVAAQKMLLGGNVFGLNFSDSTEFRICLLHSTVPKEEQAQIFEQLPPGCRKIILSTNIAETSVTVPDVRYIVDTGKTREKRYDQIRRLTKLQCVWESKTNSKQRAGRAGRVQDGFYYALFSKERHDSFKAVGFPELLRSDLQETCLSITAQKFNEPVASFLAQAIEPPPKPNVDSAVQNLTAIGAYAADENLTPLGRVLSQLPIHPSLGKMIILGVVFKCLDPMITLGATSDARPLFVSPLGRREEARRIHRSYDEDSQSDHIAFLRAFQELRTVHDQYGQDAALERSWEKYLHFGAFRQISQTADQIVEILERAGLIPQGDPQLDPQDGLEPSQYGPADLNVNADNSSLIKCLLLAGSHPNLASKTAFNGLTYRTMREQNVIIHPSSLNMEMRKAEKFSYGTLLTYSSLASSNDCNSLWLRDSSLISPLMAVLFGGDLRISGNGKLEMDEWLPFFVKSHDSQFASKLILEFRKALDRVLHTAFSSLADLDANGTDGFANDPVVERFAERVVEVLSFGTFGQRMQSAWATSAAPEKKSVLSYMER